MHVHLVFAEPKNCVPHTFALNTARASQQKWQRPSGKFKHVQWWPPYALVSLWSSVQRTLDKRPFNAESIPGQRSWPSSSMYWRPKHQEGISTKILNVRSRLRLRVHPVPRLSNGTLLFIQAIRSLWLTLERHIDGPLQGLLRGLDAGLVWRCESYCHHHHACITALCERKKNLVNYFMS